jgi:hypothetical protein
VKQGSLAERSPCTVPGVRYRRRSETEPTALQHDGFWPVDLHDFAHDGLEQGVVGLVCRSEGMAGVGGSMGCRRNMSVGPRAAALGDCQPEDEAGRKGARSGRGCLVWQRENPGAAA